MWFLFCFLEIIMSRKEGYNQYLKKLAAGKPGEPTEKTLKRKRERENELLEHGNEGKAQNFVLK